MAERGDGRLPLGGGRTAGRAHLAVRPRLLRQPLHRVVAVGDRRAEDVVVPLREEMAALVLDDVGVAALHDGERRGHVGGHAVADVPVIEVVGRLREHDRDRPGGVLRAVDVGRQPHAVAHRHHHLALDDGDGLELVLDVDAPLRVGRRESTLLRGHQGGERHDENGEAEREWPAHARIIAPTTESANGLEALIANKRVLGGSSDVPRFRSSAVPFFRS